MMEFLLLAVKRNHKSELRRGTVAQLCVKRAVCEYRALTSVDTGVHFRFTTITGQ